MKVKFCGAAEIVTGSCYLIDTGKTKILVDCGMFQGSKETTKLNYEKFIFDPKKIDFLLLTHAHIDHSGLIPKLVKAGFKGKILTTDVTIDLCGIMLEDSGHIQEMDIERENRYRKLNKLPEREPLYGVEDAKASMKYFKRINYEEPHQITKDIQVEYHDAGHIIGSAIISVNITEDGKTKKLVFSGDLGQWDVPIIQDPTMIEEADYVFLESTYGDRLHESKGLRDDLLLEKIKETFAKKGILIIPSFAIERTQELLYSINKAVKGGKFPNEPVFLDSPLAIKATEIFKKHKEFYDKEALLKYKEWYTFPNLTYTSSTMESIKLNTINRPCIIIAGSGMCTGGRVRHHLRNHIGKKKNTVLFVGYQAEGTLGRFIVNGAKRIKMMGMQIQVKADIEKIGSFSAHADSAELMKWIKGFKKINKVFIVHGESRSQTALKANLEKEGIKSYVPKLWEEVVL